MATLPPSHSFVDESGLCVQAHIILVDVADATVTSHVDPCAAQKDFWKSLADDFDQR